MHHPGLACPACALLRPAFESMDTAQLLAATRDLMRRVGLTRR